MGKVNYIETSAIDAHPANELHNLLRHWARRRYVKSGGELGARFNNVGTYAQMGRIYNYYHYRW